MAYELRCCSSHPRLLILLTDESKESAAIVNNIIDSAIQINFNGTHPKNRIFIETIGYNGNSRILASGYLKYLFEHPIRTEMIKRKISDGAGGILEVDCRIPVWIDENTNLDIYDYSHAISKAISSVNIWVKDKPNAPAPIVIDCANKCCANVAGGNIDILKQLSTNDGSTLFMGCYKEIPNGTDAFSNTRCYLQERLTKWNIDINEYSNGVFPYSNMKHLLHAIFDDFAGEVAIIDEK